MSAEAAGSTSVAAAGTTSREGTSATAGKHFAVAVGCTAAFVESSVARTFDSIWIAAG